MKPMSLDVRIDRGSEDRSKTSLGLESVVHGLGCSRDFGRIRTPEDHDRGLLQLREVTLEGLVGLIPFELIARTNELAQVRVERAPL